MHDNTSIMVNHQVLIWARDSIAMSRNQASEKTKISSKRLVQLEEGEKQPTLDELKELSKAYKRTLATLLLSIAPKEKPLPTDRRTVDSTEIGNFHEKTILAVRKARALAHSLLELKQDAGIQPTRFIYSASIMETAKEVARRLRKKWNLEEIRGIKNINLALEAYIEKVEFFGIAVFQLSLTQDNLRGFSIVDDVLPIIGIKRGAEQPTAKIFTLFHELAHILLKDGGLCDLSENTNQLIEKWCNAFAAEMLMPTDELLQMDIVLKMKRKNEIIWAKKDLIELGNYFHVGPLSILRSLLECNLTTSEFYKEKHKAWNKPTFGKAKNSEGRNIAKETFKEKGRAYITLAFSAYDQNRIDIKDLSDFLGVKLSTIPKTRQLLSA
ncbi:MAG: ImmA/IrrE family metallo-endopeptidase [Ignavibacteria bacterium]|nr:ImmA/IrrE family metallo-endopeptidase [Ignavibacteria bacterium]